MRNIGRLCSALAVISGGGTYALSASAESLIFQDHQLSVLSPTPEFSELSCILAAEAKAHLLECGLHQSSPIEIVLVEKIEHEFGDCLASYDCRDEIIRVILSYSSFIGQDLL